MKTAIRTSLLLSKIIWVTNSKKSRLKILFIIALSILSSIFQYISILLTAITFSFLSSDSIETNPLSKLKFIFGIEFNFSNISFSNLFFIWLFISLFSSLSVILITSASYKLAYNLGKTIVDQVLKIAIQSNSIFHEEYSRKTIFNLLTSENTSLVKGPIMALISFPMQITIIFTIASIILNLSSTLFIAIPILGIIYLFLSNYLTNKVKNNSVLVFDYRSQQTDILTRFIENYLDVVFPPSNLTYRSLFSNVSKKLRKLESFNAAIPRILKSFLELILIITIGFYVIYSLKVINMPIDYFISASAAIIISLFKLTPVISGLSASFLAFDDQYESIKNYHELICNSEKYNFHKISNNYSRVIYEEKNYFKIENLYSNRIKKLNNQKFISRTFKDSGLIWVIGPSGCGKSTLFSMIAGVRPINKGEIILSIKRDKTENISSKLIINYVSYMTQAPIFYSTSIRNYIKDGDEKIHDNDVKKIIKKLQIANSFNLNENKLLDLTIGPRGYSPSGGQSKLLAFARAVCKRNTELYLLDEPTSELSKEYKQIILDYIIDLSKKKFVLSITHDLDLIKENDKIIQL